MVLLPCLTVIGLYVKDYNSASQINPLINKEESKQEPRSISMMYETETGEYVESNDSTWLGDAYIFNSKLSKCENGGELSWDATTNQVIMSSNVSDRCYIYFDIKTIGKACNGQNMATCMKDNYTLDSTLLFHDENLTNGANDLSYRYTGVDYKITAAHSSEYETVYGASIETDVGVIKFNCNDAVCSTFSDYYLDYDTNQTLYTSLYEVAQQAIKDGYIENNVNNYVCFGSNATTCPEENLYRIIGLFDDNKDRTYNVKLIKYDYVTSEQLGINGNYNGKYSDGVENSKYNYKGNNYVNIAGYYWIMANRSWAESELNTLNFNTNYLENLGSTWTDKIEDATWQVYDANSVDDLVSEVSIVYQNEISTIFNDVTYTAKIGLMYISDYGYASHPDNWIEQLAFYTDQLEKNWMYRGLNEWTITSGFSSLWVSVMAVGEIGEVFYSFPNSNYAVRPTFYLNSDIVLKSGSGTFTDPYRV